MRHVSFDVADVGHDRGGRPGAGLRIGYSTHETPFGAALLGVAGGRICALHLLGPLSADQALADLRSRWPAAVFHPADNGIPDLTEPATSAPLRLLLAGTEFQRRVWRALLHIPFGEVASYDDVARAAGAPTAHRAVGTAIGRNPIALLVPCHRVIRKDRQLGGYRWGADRKRAILDWEAVHPEGTAAAV